jgi:hypothetical protein
MDNEALYTVVTEEKTYLFTTPEEFYDFMSDTNSLLAIDRIEKNDN